MGKAAMCIQMLQILSSGRVYKCSELADLLETNPRNVIEYKRELEEVGYYIISIPGKYGGYRLERSTTIPSLKLTQEEKAALAEGAGYLASRNDFIYKNGYQTAMSKIYSSMENDFAQPEPQVSYHFPLVMSESELAARYKAIDECIRLKTKMEMEYLNLKSEVSRRVLHPYTLFMYNNTWFVLGYDEKRCEIRYFKLNRIREFRRLSGQKFRVMLSYNESDYLDQYGMKENGEWYSIKLRLTGPYSMLARERVYGKNQRVVCADDATVLMCEMQNKEMVKSFVLSLGEYCEILEPEWLKEELLALAEKYVVEKKGKR